MTALARAGDASTGSLCSCSGGRDELLSEVFRIAAGHGLDVVRAGAVAGSLVGRLDPAGSRPRSDLPDDDVVTGIRAFCFRALGLRPGTGSQAGVFP